MTYDQFLEQVNLAHETQSEQRLGQIYFNLLSQVRPQIAEELRGSMLDPFFKHRITQVTNDFVSQRWSKDAA